MFKRSGHSRLALSAIMSISIAVSAVQPAFAESINGALASAYQNNPTLNAQRASTRVADEGIAIAKSGYRPTVAGSANIGRSYSNSNAPRLAGGGSSTTLSPGGFGVSISQTLWDSFLTRNNVSAARSAVKASQEALRNTEQNVLFDGASAYLDVLRDRAILSFQRRNLEFLNEQVRSEQSRFDVGESTRTDVSQATASRAAAQASVSLAEANLKTSEAVYRQIIGSKPGNLSPVKGVSRLIPRNVNSAMRIAESEHPAIKSTEYIVDQAQFNVKAAESGLLPTLNLEGQVSRNFDQSATASVAESASVTATLRVPIYQAGRQSATVRQQKETLGQRRIEVDQSVDSVRAAVVSAFSQYQGAVASARANEEQLRAARLALQGAVEERKVGQRTTLDVLNTQSQVINAQISLASSNRDVKVAGYAILSAIGRLSASRLGLRVATYDPKDHQKAVEDKWFGLRTPSGN